MSLDLISDPRRIKEKREMRERLAAEQGGRCCYCGVRFGARIRHWTAKLTRATIDHIWPRSLGGSDAWENLVAACARCNKLRGTQSAHAFWRRRGWIANSRDRAMERDGWLARAIRWSVPAF